MLFYVDCLPWPTTEHSCISIFITHSVSSFLPNGEPTRNALVNSHLLSLKSCCIKFLH